MTKIQADEVLNIVADLERIITLRTLVGTDRASLDEWERQCLKQLARVTKQKTGTQPRQSKQPGLKPADRTSLAPTITAGGVIV